MRARAQLGREESSRAIGRATGDLADLAEKAAAQAAAVLRNGRRALPRALTGRCGAGCGGRWASWSVTIERTATVVAQARSRLAGQMPDGATRLVSLHDPDARPIRKGRIDRPVEFGYKAQVAGQRRWHRRGLQRGMRRRPATARSSSPPSRGSPAGPGRVPRAVTADRGYGQAAVERDLHAPGVRTVAIPRQATTSSGPQGRRARPRLPQTGQMAYRLRRPDQLPQTPLQLGPHAAGHQERERRSGAGTGYSPTTWSRSPLWPADPAQPTTRPAQGVSTSSRQRLFQVEVTWTTPSPRR